MNNDQFKVTEKDKKALKKLWFFLFFYILLMMYLLYFRIWLGQGDNVRTIVFAIVLVFLITNTIFLILKVKKRIHEKKDKCHQRDDSFDVKSSILIVKYYDS